MLESSKMWAELDRIRNCTSKLPAKAFAREHFLDGIGRELGITPKPDVVAAVGMATFAGMPVHVSEILPKGVLCMFTDKDNMPIGMIVDDTYESQSNQSKDQKS